MSKKKRLNQDDFKTYNMLDERCGILHKLIRGERDKTKLLGYFDELIRTYDKMSGMIRPSWMERIAIRQLVRTRDALRKSKHVTRPKDVPNDEELEEIVRDKEKLKATLRSEDAL